MIVPSFSIMFIDLDVKGKTMPLFHESGVKIFAQQNFLFSYFLRKKEAKPRGRRGMEHAFFVRTLGQKFS